MDFCEAEYDEKYNKILIKIGNSMVHGLDILDATNLHTKLSRALEDAAK